jgi:cytidylate kinase
VEGDILLRFNAMAKKPIIVAVDGPAGSGKSSLCSVVAKKIGWTTLNTGLIYRTVAYIGIKKGVIQVDGEKILSVDEFAMIDLAQKLIGELVWDGEKAAIYWHGEDLTSILSEPMIGRGASSIAKIPGIRKVLLDIQRAIAMRAHVGILVDGRDIGTVVFPDADLKIFLTASLEERSKRRFDQLQRDLSTSPVQDKAQLGLELIKQEIAARDQQDSTRKSAPLIKGDDAVLFDTSSLNFDESVTKLLELLKTKKLIH